jgi:hypothetical protein
MRIVIVLADDFVSVYARAVQRALTLPRAAEARSCERASCRREGYAGVDPV